MCKLNEIRKHLIQVSAQKKPFVPACANRPKITKLSDCCPNYPNLIAKNETAVECTKKCPSNDKKKLACCFNDCAMAEFGVLTMGEYDPASMKAALVKMIVSEEWSPEVIKKFNYRASNLILSVNFCPMQVIEKVISECVEKGECLSLKELFH